MIPVARIAAWLIDYRVPIKLQGSYVADIKVPPGIIGFNLLFLCQ